jgi:hypothetical protein
MESLYTPLGVPVGTTALSEPYTVVTTADPVPVIAVPPAGAVVGAVTTGKGKVCATSE